MTEMKATIESEEGLFKAVSLKLPTNFVDQEKINESSERMILSQEKLQESFKTLSETFTEKFIPKSKTLPTNDNEEISEDLYTRTNEKITDKLQDLIDGTRHVFDSLDAIRKGNNSWRKDEEIDQKKERSEEQELRNEEERPGPIDGLLDPKKSFFKKISEGFVKKGIFSKVLGGAVVGGMVGSFIPGIISKIFGTLRMWLPNFMGEVLDKSEAALTTGKFSKWVGKLVKGVKILSAIAAVAGSIYLVASDALQYEIMSKKWKTSKFSSIIGTILGSTSYGWKNAFKQAGKYGVIGAGIGFVAGGPPGAIIGGVVGGVVGGLLGFFGGKWISRKIDGAVNSVKRFSDRILGTSFILNEKDLKKLEIDLEKDIKNKRRKFKENEYIMKNYSRLIERSRLKGNRYQEQKLKLQLQSLRDENQDLDNDIRFFETQLKQTKEDIKSSRGWLRTKLKSVWNFIGDEFKQSKEGFGKLIDLMKNSIKSLVGKIKDYFSNLYSKLKNFSFKKYVPWGGEINHTKDIENDNNLESLKEKKEWERGESKLFLSDKEKIRNFERLKLINEKIRKLEKTSLLNLEKMEQENKFSDRPKPAKIIQLSEYIDQKLNEKKTQQQMTAIASVGSMSVNSNNKNSSTIITPVSPYNSDHSISRMRDGYLRGNRR